MCVEINSSKKVFNYNGKVKPLALAMSSLSVISCHCFLFTLMKMLNGSTCK